MIDNAENDEVIGYQKDAHIFIAAVVKIEPNAIVRQREAEENHKRQGIRQTRAWLPGIDETNSPKQEDGSEIEQETVKVMAQDQLSACDRQAKRKLMRKGIDGGE